MRVYHEYLIENKIVPWTTWNTTKEKIKREGFPAIQMNEKKRGGHHGYCFDLEKVNQWFVEREKNQSAS